MKKNKRLFRLTMLVFLILFGLNTVGFCLAIPENGVQRLYYENGKLRLESRFKDGRVVRKRAFYRNGRLLLDEKYKNGLATYKKSYWDNGKLKSIWTQKNGVTKFYHKNGKLRVVVDHDLKDLHEDLPSSLIFSGGK